MQSVSMLKKPSYNIGPRAYLVEGLRIQAAEMDLLLLNTLEQLLH